MSFEFLLTCRVTPETDIKELLGSVDILFFCRYAQISKCIACSFNAFGPTASLVASDAF